MMSSGKRLRAFLRDSPRFERILVVLAERENRELLRWIAEAPADARTLGDRTGRQVALIRNGLVRLARVGLLASAVVARKRVYRLSAGVAVDQGSRYLAVRIETRAGSAMHLRMPYGTRPAGRQRASQRRG